MAITNVEELREFLANDLERVSKGDISPATANASANLSGKILQSVKLELQYNAAMNATPNINFLGSMKKSINKSLDIKNKEITLKIS